MAARVHEIDSMLQPTAAEMYQANLLACGNHELSLKAALEDTERLRRELRWLLAETEDGGGASASASREEREVTPSTAGPDDGPAVLVA
jgi:hypothetical protein